MNVPTWVGWIFVAMLTILSTTILSGKAIFFIAGYNTAKKEQKDKYNKNALSKVVGGGFLFITGIIALIVYYNAELPSAIAWLNPWGILGTIALIFTFGNTICKK